MKRREPDLRQGDLFQWAAQRPTAIILDIIGPIAKRMWAERKLAPVNRGGTVVVLPPHDDERRRA